MTREALLELQTAIISCLTDPCAMAEFKAGNPDWEILDGIDPSRIELLGSLAEGKRIDKVKRVFPRTFAYLKVNLKEMVKEFSARYPPISASSYTNACQFYAFLRRSWRTHDPDPPFLPDLAYCELAMISIGRRIATTEPAVLDITFPSTLGPLLIRRRPGTRWRLCQYNIQPLLDQHRQDAVNIMRQQAYVILSRTLNATGVRAFQVDEALFEIIKSLRSWTRLVPTDGLFDNMQTVNLFRKLETLGILEVRLCESA